MATVTAKNWTITQSTDGKRHSRYPAGDYSIFTMRDPNPTTDIFVAATGGNDSNSSGIWLRKQNNIKIIGALIDNFDVPIYYKHASSTPTVAQQTALSRTASSASDLPYKSIMVVYQGGGGASTRRLYVIDQSTSKAVDTGISSQGYIESASLTADGANPFYLKLNL